MLYIFLFYDFGRRLEVSIFWHLAFRLWKNYSISPLEQSGVEVEYDVVQQQAWQCSVTGNGKREFRLPDRGYADLFINRSFCTYYRKEWIYIE